MPVNDSFDRFNLQELVFGPDEESESVGDEAEPARRDRKARRRESRNPSGYLPAVGSLAMRYGEARGWPTPLPAPVEMAVVAPEASLVSGPGAAPSSEGVSGATEGDGTVAVSDGGVVQPGSPQNRIRRWTATSTASSNSPGMSGMVVLSPDFVLGRLSDAPAGDAGVPTRFVPAVPNELSAPLESVLSPP